MTLDKAIADLKAKITAVSPEAVIREQRAAQDEARIRVYAPADHEAPIKAATVEPTIQLMMQDGLDIQVFVYDIATSLPPEE
jgi:hypothetical protein